jgi:peroxiredoxin
MIKAILKASVYGFLAVIIIAGCSGDDATKEARVQGTITVADSTDSSGNYAGIGVTIIKKDSANVNADTLFNATTDADGMFSGIAAFPKRGQYIMYISRNDQNLGRTGVILAEGDTVKISAQLPGLSQTLQINSIEHNALTTYQRVDKGFQRVRAFAQAGRLKGDSLVTELMKWPDIYWDVYQENPETLAGKLSAQKSIELLNEWDKPAMMQKIRQIQADDDLAYLGATYGKMYIAETKDLSETLSYLDSLKRETQNPDSRMRIQMEGINLLYDSARVEQAQTSLQAFKKKYGDNEAAKKWAESIQYDLNYLSPGDPIPDFSFANDGKKISREMLKGRPYLLEITSLSSPLYQRQFDRTMVLHSIYKNYNFEVITIPLETSQVTVEAFFEERMQPWPVAPAQAFNNEEIIKKFNIKIIPTRFLVDEQGRIARRYIGQEYDDVIKGIQQLFNEKNNSL